MANFGIIGVEYLYLCIYVWLCNSLFPASLLSPIGSPDLPTLTFLLPFPLFCPVQPIPYRNITRAAYSSPCTLMMEAVSSSETSANI
jgi:hypothetical protein